MKRKFFASLVVLTFAFGVSSVSAQMREAGNQTGVRQTQPLVNLLPASDGAASVNIERLLSDALPQMLSGNQAMLADVLRHIDEVKAKTGIDLRQFEQIVVGISAKQGAARKINFEPVVLARGTFNAGALLAVAKTAANGKYREEKIGTRSVFIFTPKDAVRQTGAQASTTKTSVLLPGLGIVVSGDWLKMLSNEFAVSLVDNNTLAIGSTARVRETLGAGARVGGEVLTALNRQPNALLNFGLKVPAGFSQFINLGNDEISRNLDAVRFVSGAADIADGSASVSMAAKTANVEQAESLQQQLEGLQMLGRAFLGGAKGADKQIYARLINDLKITRSGGEVALDLSVAQTDINFLLDKFSKPKPELNSSK